MNLNNLTIIEGLNLLRHKKISAVELIQSHFDRIDKIDPQVKAYLYVDRQGALKEAEKKDQDGQFDQPLSGIPVAIKDALVTTDMPATAGSKILEGYLSPYDATVVTRLKEAGAIIIGKTNLDEFAMGSSTENSAYQLTHNPWDYSRVPGGSGGGSAAAICADLAVAALGSDTGGSIRQPASFTGTVGLKPTYGRVSRYGLIALASSLDQVGPVTKDVADASYLLELIAGVDEFDATTLNSPVDKYHQDLSKMNFSKLKVGLPKEYFGGGVDKGVAAVVQNTVKKLEDLGVTISWVSLPSSEQALSVYYVLMPSEASSNLARYDGIRFGPRAEVSSVLDVYLKTREQGFGDEPKRRIILGTYALSAGYQEGFYKKALSGQAAVKADFDKVFEQVDLLISPTSPTVSFKFGEASTPLQMYMNDILTLPSNLAGNCSISLPVGLHDGLPVGLQIIGPNLAESKILQLAKKIEDLVEFTKLGEPHELI